MNYKEENLKSGDTLISKIVDYFGNKLDFPKMDYTPFICDNSPNSSLLIPKHSKITIKKIKGDDEYIVDIDTPKGSIKNVIKYVLNPEYYTLCSINENINKTNNPSLGTDNIYEKILKKGNKWQVTDHTGTKNLGTYDTKEDAEKRLKQVEYFKHINESEEDMDIDMEDLERFIKSITINKPKQNYAPNGRLSALPNDLYNKVRIDNFKNWFGDWENDKDNSSKILDSNGEPKIVYHGTDAEFNTFDTKNGIYFTDKKDVAETYSKSNNILPCFLNIRHPYIMDCEGNDWNFLGTDKESQSTRTIVKKILQDNKYDGIIFKNIVDLGKYSSSGMPYCWNSNVYVIKDPSQVKSIDSQFSTESNNMYESITAYHGTDKSFNRFDLNKSKDSLGVFFTPNLNDAKKYGKNIISAELHLNNPLVVYQGEDYKNKLSRKPNENEEGLRQRLLANGYDGVIINYNNPAGGYTTEYVVLDPNKIEILNKLTESNNIPKILYRDDCVYGSGIKDIKEVINYEINELNNLDIPLYCNEHYNLSANLKKQIENERFEDNFADELVNNINKITNKNLKYCLWLTTKEAVEEVYDGENAIPYYTSDIIISDLDYDGILFAYEEEPQPIEELIEKINPSKIETLNKLNEDVSISVGKGNKNQILTFGSRIANYKLSLQTNKKNEAPTPVSIHSFYEKLDKTFNADYYRIILKDKEELVGNNLGFYTGVGQITDNIDMWCEDEEEAREIKGNLNYKLDTLQQWLPLPNVKDPKIKFAYKKDKFLQDFKLIDEIDDIIRNLDMGFSLDYEPVYPDKIVYEDDYQIGYISKIKESKEDNFKKWFGNSKVINEDGSPKVVYHGTKKAGFTEFKYDKDHLTGDDFGETYFFTDSKQVALGYAYNIRKDPRYIERENEKDRLIKELLADPKNEEKRQNALNYMRDNELWDLFETPFLTNGSEIKEVYLRIETPKVIQGYGKNFREVYPKNLENLKLLGYDGVIIENVQDNAHGDYVSTIYVVFEPNQIKSVDNNGNFSLESNNIYESKNLKLYHITKDETFDVPIWNWQKN